MVPPPPQKNLSKQRNLEKELLHDPATPLLRTPPKELKSVCQNDICSYTPLTRAKKIELHRCPLAAEGIKKICNNVTPFSHKSELVIFVTT